MTVRNLLTINAVYIGLLVLIALFAPALLIETNGLEVTPSTLNLQRAMGAVASGYVIVSWLMRSAPPSEARQAFLIGAGAGYILFAVVIAIDITITPDLGTSIGWVYVVINLLLAAGLLNFAVRRPTST